MHSTKDETFNRTDATGRAQSWWALWLCIGAALGGLGVVIGAAGTHVLEGRIDSDSLDTLETAVRFQMYHGIALAGLGVAARVWQSGVVTLAAVLMTAGTVVFCSSLYILALSGVGLFGAIAPVGGLCLIAGWAALAIGAGVEFIRRTGSDHR